MIAGVLEISHTGDPDPSDFENDKDIKDEKKKEAEMAKLKGQKKAAAILPQDEGHLQAAQLSFHQDYRCTRKPLIRL
jgi:hypothetical protein